MIFIDSNIIAYSFYDNQFREKCQNILFKGGMINSLVLIESFNIIEYQINRQYAVSCIKSLIKSNFKIIEINTNIIFEALKRSSRISLNFLDLIHYTCAEINNCKKIITYDKHFLNSKLNIKCIKP